jgi:hypothetical protein
MEKTMFPSVRILLHKYITLSLGLLVLAGMVGPAYTAALAQTPTPQVLSVTIGQFDVSKYPEITIYVNVADSSGKYVTNLVQSDFAVTEDGKPVTMSGFAGIGEKRPVDIVFVFDTTGSMEEEINGVVRTSLAFADALVSKGRDYRLGLVTFADQVLLVNNGPASATNAMTADATEFKSWVSKLVASGGEGDQENDYAAIHRALQLTFRSEAQKIFILITDAPPHHTNDPADGGVIFTDPVLNYQPTLDKLKAQNVSLYAVTPNLSEFTQLASETGGRFYDIQINPDFTGIIEGIGATLASQYRITYTSPRPTYDGTRRDVQVTVRGARAGEVYAEQHLINIQSNCLVGLACCFPLALLLVVPLAAQAILRRSRKAAPQAVAGEVPPPAIQPEVSQAATWVGTSPPPQPPSPQPPQASLPPSPQPLPQAATRPAIGAGEAAGLVCQKCGNPLRAEARFCPVCGQPAPPPAPAAAEPPIVEQRQPAIPTPTNCPNCGNALRPGVKFCNVCGFKVNRPGL